MALNSQLASGLSVDHMTDAFWINRIQFSSQTGGGTLTLRGGYPRFRVRESGHRTFRVATQILHAYRMVHKINTDRLYEMHGTPGGTIRDPELKIVLYIVSSLFFIKKKQHVMEVVWR